MTEQRRAQARRASALLGLACLALAASCSSEGTAFRCRKGLRVADIVVQVRRDLPPDIQLDLIYEHFEPLEDVVAGTRDYSISVGYAESGPEGASDPTINVFLDAAIDPPDRQSVRRTLLRQYDEIEAVDFDRRPVGGSGELC